jgi:SEC-C motif-containing protein
MERECPCGSGATYAACCRPFHDGSAIAPTALALMRSRYSAFALGDAPYLLATWHPATRPGSVDLDAGLQWRRLQIRGRTDGAEHDDTGTVEFVAHYWDPAHGEYGRQQENSRFRRRSGRWFYVDAAGGPGAQADPGPGHRPE